MFNTKFIAVVLATLIFVALPVVVFAQPSMTDQSAAFAGGANFDATPQDPRLTIAFLISMTLSLLGVALMGYFLYGGYMIMTASGVEDRIAQGKRAIWTSVVGAGILLASYGIGRYVILLIDYAAEPPDPTYQIDEGFSVDINIGQDENVPVDPLYDDVSQGDEFWDAFLK